MARFGPTSQKQLVTIEGDLQKVLQEAIKYFDFSVVEGYRGKEAQDKAWEEGNSQLKWPNSQHNHFPSQAADLAPYPQDWSGREKAHLRFAFMMGVVHVCAQQLGVKIRFGMDWNRNLDPRDERFIDLPHVELDR